VIRAIDQVVAADLVDPLRVAEPGDRYAVDAAGAPAGAVRVDAARVTALLDRLRADLSTSLELPDAEAITVGPRARHPAGTDDELRAARAWQWQLVNKPLDAFLTRRVWRPLARPLTKIFLHLPFSPNQISIACIAFSVLGGVIAAAASWKLHALGFGIYFFAALLDNVDGEVARLRLESSRIGGWIDTIGDDVARVGVLIGVFFHVSAKHPDLPIDWLFAITLFNALLANVLLYWWCIFVGKTYNNQEYAKVIGAAPHLESTGRSWKRMISDFGAQAARRDFLDVAVIVLALVDLSEISMAGLFVGQAIGVIIIVPIHLRIVKQRREQRPVVTS
jgi:phosphatidylglycerophosphate synthase